MRLMFKRTKTARLVAGVYIAFGATWIVTSDLLFARTLAEGYASAIIPIGKGMIFVFLSGALIYIVVQWRMSTLVASEERFHLAAENYPALFVIYDKHLVVTFANGAVARLSKLPSRDLIGKKDTELSLPGGVMAYRSHLIQTLSTKVARVVEILYEEDGKQGKIKYTCVPVLDSSGDVREILGIAFDLSREFEMEQQVNQASKWASLGEMASRIVNDLTQPLTVIQMGAEFVLQSLKSTVSKDLLNEEANRILQNVQKSNAIIEELRLLAPTSEVNSAIISVSELIDQTTSLLDARLKLHNIDLRIQLPRDPLFVFGVADRLQQVLVNVLLNGIECFAGDESIGKWIQISLERTQTHRVIMTISNNGPQIHVDDIGRVFEPFFSTKKRGPQSQKGLGLSVGFGIIRSHGGIIAVKNTKDGVAFMIDLPSASAMSL